MIIKEEFTYNKVDTFKQYSLIDNVDKVEVGCENKANFVNVFKRDRKLDSEYTKHWVLDTTIYICSDTGKTLQIIRPEK